MSISAIHLHEPATGIHMPPPSWTSHSLSVLSHPSRLSQGMGWSSPHHTANPQQLSISRVVIYIYMLQCCCLNSAHPLPPLLCPRDCSLCLHLCACGHSATKSCLTFRDPMNCSVPDFPVLYYLLGFAQTHVHWVSDATQSSHLLLPLALQIGSSVPSF